MEPDPIQILATVAVLGVVVKGIVDAIRRQWPGLDGLVVQVAAVLVGAGIAWALDVRATEALLESVNASVGRIPPPALDYVVTGVAMAAAAGFLAEIAGRSGGNVGTIIEVDETGTPVH
jgi:hypothetical protein